MGKVKHLPLQNLLSHVSTCGGRLSGEGRRERAGVSTGVPDAKDSGRVCVG